MSTGEISQILTRRLIADGIGFDSIEHYIPQNPTPRQKLFLDLEDKLEVFYGGAAGGGKSSALLMGALKYVHIPGYAALLLRRSYTDLSLPGALMDRANQWLQGKAHWSGMEKKWTFPSGATLTFGYLATEVDKYQYQGAEFQYIGFDELSQFTETQYTYLFSRLRRLKDGRVPLRLRSGSNPGGVGALWVKERFIPDDFSPEFAVSEKIWEKHGEDEETGEKLTRYFVPARLDDNPHLDQHQYELSLRNLDPVTRAQLRRGDWQITLRGDILYQWDESQTIVPWSRFKNVLNLHSNTIPAHWRIGVFQDWGCLTLDTKILTKRGWKARNELIIGEPVATYDWENTNQVKWTPLLHIVDKPNKKLVRLKNKSFDFTATDDHNWIFKRKKHGRMIRDTYGRRQLPDLPKNAGFVIAAECHEPPEIDVTPQEMAIFAWGLTDGSISNNSLSICQKNYVDKVIEDLEASGAEWHEIKPKPNGVRCFTVSAKWFKPLREKLNYNGKEDLPALIPKLSFEVRAKMIEVMMWAEGTGKAPTREKTTFCQNSGPVLEAFQILCTLNGIRLSLERPHLGGFQQYLGKPEYRTGKRVSQIRYPIMYRPERIPLEGLHDTWCPSVKEGSVIAKNELGQITITGNTTKDHPCITAWFATAAENAPEINGVPIAGSVFLYRLLIESQCTARDVKKQVYELMLPEAEVGRCTQWQMSHEASSERLEYLNTNDELGFSLPFSAWETGKTRGIEQLKYSISQRNAHLPHPFNEGVMGHPKLYILVSDDQVINPRTVLSGLDYGMSRIRAEAPAYRWDVPKSGDPPKTLVPYPLFNDAMDVCRAAAACYWPRMEEFTTDELLQKETYKHINPDLEKRLSESQPLTEGQQMSLMFAQQLALKKMQQDGYLDEFGLEPDEWELPDLSHGW